MSDRSRDRVIDNTIEKLDDLKQDIETFIETRPIEIATIIAVCGLFYWIRQYVST